MEELQALIDRADHDALLVAVDDLAGTGQWDRLADLARRCREAVEFGRQVWGVATYIDYRLALQAPPEHAGAVLRPGAGRFALGPLTEVAANRLAWSQLAPHVAEPVSLGVVAAERALRGEDLRSAAVAADTDLPPARFPFEPAYALPVYRERDALFPAPELPGLHDAGNVQQRPPPLPRQDRAVHDALTDVCAAWCAGQAASVTSAQLPGDDVGAAIAALVGDGGFRTAALSGAQALAWLQWCAASGGYQGPRPGGAAGRFAAWWAVATLGGLVWPDDDVEGLVAALESALAQLSFVRWWREDEPDAGWVLRLAGHAPAIGLVWAVEGHDPPMR